MRKDAVERALIRHKDSVYRQMIRVCGHQQDAEDALATAMMLAFQHAEKLESEDAFRSWIGTIGKRVCTRMRAHPKIDQAFQLAEGLELIDPNTTEMEIPILKGCVQSALDQLSHEYREIYELCELQEYTVPEAAEKLGIGLAAAKSRLLRARAKVRESLDHSICAP